MVQSEISNNSAEQHLYQTIVQSEISNNCAEPLIDIIMLNKSGAKLKTSDLQFAYKAGMSTTMCSTVLKEVVQYYTSNDGHVYGCVLDASKAFDRIKYDKPFEILLERHFPVRYISLLIDSYINQDITVPGETLCLNRLMA